MTDWREVGASFKLYLYMPQVGLDLEEESSQIAVKLLRGSTDVSDVQSQ